MIQAKAKLIVDGRMVNQVAKRANIAKPGHLGAAIRLLADLNRYTVLGINGPIITPYTNLDSFENKVVVLCTIARHKNHVGRYIINLQPLKAAAISMAYAAGACRVKITVPTPPRNTRTWRFLTA